MIELSKQISWRGRLRDDVYNVVPLESGIWSNKCTAETEILEEAGPIFEDWLKDVPNLISSVADEVRSRLMVYTRLENIENKLLLINASVTELQKSQSTIVLIETMAPEPIEIVRPFHVNIEPYEDEYQAFFLDANLCAYGNTKSAAIWNLKDLITATFQNLCEINEDKLGPGPARQLKILRNFIRIKA